MAEAGITQVDEELSLDPFSFQPGSRSKIAGVGGTEQSTDFDYAFHTQYVPAGEGHAHFKVRVGGLTGKLGTIVLRVHMYQEGASSVRLVTAERILLSRMTALRGTYDVKFEAFRGVIYALYGGIQGETDAAAESLEIALSYPATAEGAPEVATEARNSAYGRDAVRPSTHLISVDRATLAAPVSQMCTGPQLREPVFREWTKRLLASKAPPLEQWGSAYVLQVLDRYGMLSAGARGLGFAAGRDGVAALAAAADISVLVLDEREVDEPTPQNAATVGSDPSCPNLGRGNVSHRTVQLGTVPRDLVNYDFLWSDRVLSRQDSVAAGTDLAQKMMACLRPSGLAVHLIDLELLDGRTEPVPDITPFRRRDLDRLALILISRGHEVAQIKVDSSRAPTLGGSIKPGNAITLCGLITRKAQTVE